MACTIQYETIQILKNSRILYVFTALHVMQMRYSEENSVRPSVRLSVTRVIPDKTEEICPDFYTIRKNIHPSLLRRRMVGGGRPLLSEILGPALLRNLNNKLR